MRRALAIVGALCILRALAPRDAFAVDGAILLQRVDTPVVTYTITQTVTITRTPTITTTPLPATATATVTETRTITPTPHNIYPLLTINGMTLLDQPEDLTVGDCLVVIDEHHVAAAPCPSQFDPNPTPTELPCDPCAGGGGGATATPTGPTATSTRTATPTPTVTPIAGTCPAGAMAIASGLGGWTCDYPDLFWDAANGFLGIGSAGSPVFPLDVRSTITATSGSSTTVTGQFTTTIEPPSTSTASSRGLQVLMNVGAGSAADLSGAGNNAFVAQSMNLVSGVTVGDIRGGVGHAFCGSNNNTPATTANCKRMVGLQGQPSRSSLSSATTDSILGIFGNAQNFSTAGTITDLGGALFYPTQVGVGSVVTNGYGMRVRWTDPIFGFQQLTAGTLTNTFGLWIDGLGAGATATFTNPPEQIRLDSCTLTGCMGIRQKGSQPNRLQGFTKIGADSAAATALDVAGTVTATGLACPDCVPLGSGTTGNYVASVATTSPLSGGASGSEGAALTIAIADAAADGSTKGAASFTAADFNASSGNISIDYTNGQAASASNKGFLTSSDWSTFNSKQDGPLSGDVVTSGAVATIQPNSVALTTDTTGNYVTSISVASPVACTGCTAAEGGTPALSIAADSITTTQVDETSTFVFSNLGDVTFQKETAADVTVTGSTTSGAAGGALNLSAGAGASAGTAAGGAVAVTAGAGGASGGTGGTAALTAGNGTLSGGFGASGGAINIKSGDATVLGQTGAINITGGSGGSGTGGIAMSTAASAGNSAQTGIAISTGNASGGTSSAAGNIALTAGTGTATGAGAGGGDIALTAGAGATNGNGGDVTLTAGANAGSGAAGVVAIAAGAGSGTDKDGGTSTVSPGASTGLGRAIVRIMKYIASTATGSGANTAVEAVVVGGFKALTNNTVTTLASATLASNTSAGIVVKYSVEVIDGSNHVQNETGEVICSVLNSNGTFLANGTNGCTKTASQQGVTASGGGTLTVTWTMTGANPSLVRINANSNLTPSTGYPRVNYELHNLTSQAVAVNQ